MHWPRIDYSIVDPSTYWAQKIHSYGRKNEDRSALTIIDPMNHQYELIHHALITIDYSIVDPSTVHMAAKKFICMGGNVDCWHRSHV
jgi:hypothetical protein